MGQHSNEHLGSIHYVAWRLRKSPPPSSPAETSYSTLYNQFMTEGMSNAAALARISSLQQDSHIIIGRNAESEPKTLDEFINATQQELQDIGKAIPVQGTKGNWGLSPVKTTRNGIGDEGKDNFSISQLTSAGSEGRINSIEYCHVDDSGKITFVMYPEYDSVNKLRKFSIFFFPFSAPTIISRDGFKGNPNQAQTALKHLRTINRALQG